MQRLENLYFTGYLNYDILSYICIWQNKTRSKGSIICSSISKKEFKNGILKRGENYIKKKNNINLETHIKKYVVYLFLMD